MDSPEKYSEASVVFMKIIGAVVAVISFRWVAKIFAGPDGRFSVTEFGRMVGFFFFLSAGGYMLYQEGNRDHEWQIYSEWYIGIVFASLLTVLHLDSALDKIFKIMEAMAKVRSSKPVEVKQTETTGG